MVLRRIFVRVIKSRRMRWRGVWRVWGRGEARAGFWWGNLRERSNLGDPSADGIIILRWIFRKWDVGYELDRAGLG